MGRFHGTGVLGVGAAVCGCVTLVAICVKWSASEERLGKVWDVGRHHLQSHRAARGFQNESSENVGRELLDHQGHWWVELMSFPFTVRRPLSEEGLVLLLLQALLDTKPQQSGL